MPTPDGWDERAVPGGGAAGDQGAVPGGGAVPEGALNGRAQPEGGAAPPAGAASAGSAGEIPGLGGEDAALAGEIPFRPLSISEILDGAIACVRLYPRAVLGPSVAITTVIQVAGSVAAYFFVGRSARGEVSPGWVVRSIGTQFTLGIFGLVLSALGIVLLAGLLSPVLGRGLFGLPASLRGAWRDTRPRAGRLIGVGVTVTLVPLLGLALPVLPFVLFLAVDAHPALGVLAALIGFPVGVVLMVWLYVLLVLAAPAVVMERESFEGALRRAYALSRGRWWRTCGTMLLAILVTIFMGFFALRIPFLLVELVFFGGGGMEDSQTALALSIDTLGRIVSWSVVLPFDAGVIALLYIDRRMRREGFDLELRTRALERRGVQAAADAPATASAGDDGFFEHWRPSPPPQPRPQPVQYGPQYPPGYGPRQGPPQYGSGAMP
ncbi:glycerophosphoryl diester phosphodiesterase membrane domain-containing protein [Actinomadura vinacea]|uniref:Glycerophosphoryl diester phosphodiesterase membrane domain-containing protein n=1 Tax=Actinomadura vinacea TaxID=115336 RepID=A0ABN3J9P0_9ACTN